MINKKIFTFTAILSILFFSCNNKNLPDKIKNLPRKLEIKHSHSELYAEKDSNTGYYYWRHKTSVTSPDYDAKIIEFGTYNYKKGKWILGNIIHKPYGPERFEIWYSKQNPDKSWEFCKDAVLEKGITYTDVSNYSIKNANLVERNGLWYYIAENPDGELIMGYARYHANPELKNNKNE